MPKDVDPLRAEGPAPRVPPEHQAVADQDPVADRIRAAASGLAPLVARAEQVQRARATEQRGAPRWTDVFTTQFTEFSNRPR